MIVRSGLWMICGVLGSGKTLFLTWLAKRYHEIGYTVYANFDLKFAKDKLPSEILMMDDYENCFLALDELWTVIDSRQSMSGQNEFLNSVILKSRKRGVVIAGTSQMPHMVDKRFRHIADFRVLCTRKGRERDRAASIRYAVATQDFRAKDGWALQRPKRIRVSEVCDLYDTTEEIENNPWLYNEKIAERIRKMKGPDGRTLLKELTNATTLTQKRDLLQDLAKVKRSKQIPILRELNLL